jgi:hypothetical protein
MARRTDVQAHTSHIHLFSWTLFDWYRDVTSIFYSQAQKIRAKTTDSTNESMPIKTIGKIARHFHCNVTDFKARGRERHLCIQAYSAEKSIYKRTKSRRTA